MKILDIIDEDFINYKKPCMTIMFPYCDLKCDKEYGQSICQNSSLLKQSVIDISREKLIKRYLNNSITEAICMQGMEPCDSFQELYNFIIWLRNIYHCNDDIIIYTGYNKEEIINYLDILLQFKNIIIKYGRYIPNHQSHYDPVLGVNLASDNQYAEKIS